MKILHVSYDMGIGGAERALFQLIRGQVQAGMQPSLAVLASSGFYGQRVAELGVPVVELNQKSSIDFGITEKFIGLAKQNDCVHFQTQTLTLMRAVGRSGQVPTAYTHRGGELRVNGKRRVMHYIAGRYAGVLDSLEQAHP